MAVKKGLGKSLGRGLDAFMMPDGLDSIDSDHVKGISMAKIYPNPNQPRKNFDKESLNSLCESIKQHGVVQPIILKEIDCNYMIIAGERRFRAAQMAGLDNIPAILVDYDDATISKIALVENLQRENLNPVEEANAYLNLINNYDMNQEDVSKAVGKSRSHVANTIRLLKLSDYVLNLLSKDKLSSGHCRAILRLEEVDQKLVADRILTEELNVRETEKTIQQILDGDGGKDDVNQDPNNRSKGKKNTTGKSDKGKTPEIKKIERRLEDLLSTNVNIKEGRISGKIEIEFYGEDDLDRIINFIL